MINSWSTPRCCDTRGLVPRGAPGGTRPTRPALDSLMETSPNLARTTDNLVRPTARAPDRLAMATHTQRPGSWRGQRGWPTVCPRPGPLPTPCGSQSRPHMACPRAGCHASPRDMPDAGRWPGHALSKELGSLGTPGTPRAHSLQELQNSDPRAPCSRLSTQPASSCVVFLPQQTAKGRFLGNCPDLCSHWEEG